MMVTDAILAIIALSLVGLAFRRAGGTYLAVRGHMLVACPEGAQHAAVQLAAAGAALGALFGKPALRLRDCSRWHEQSRGREDCGQACVKQIQAAPKECLVRTILAKWYRGKACVCCGGPVGEFRWRQHKPCLMSPELRILEWRDIQPERIPRLLETCSPVCWNCLVAETHTW